MGKPSEAEYLKAKEKIAMCHALMAATKEHMLNVIDVLTNDRNSLEIYENAIEENTRIVLSYEAYQALDQRK